MTTGASAPPATMRVSVLHEAGRLELADWPVPAPGPGEVLVAVRSVGVCGSDVHYFQHGRIGDFVVRSPLVLGHEVSGRIAAAGPGVDPRRVGSRVAVEPGAACGACAQCKAGRYNLCPDMRFFATPPVDGALAEYVVVRADLAFDLPDAVSDDAAALLEPLSVGIWATGKARLTAGSSVLIAGAGPIGLVAAQVARAGGRPPSPSPTSRRTGWRRRCATARRWPWTPATRPARGRSSTRSWTARGRRPRSARAWPRWRRPAGRCWSGWDPMR